MKRIPLRTKLVLHSAFLVLGAVASVGVSLFISERHYLVRRFDQTQEDNVNSLVQIRRESVAANNDQLLASYLSLLRRSRALSYAMVLDEGGRVVAHTNPAFVDQKLTDPVSLRAAETRGLLRQQTGLTDDVVDLALPILKGTRRLGVARVGYSRTSMAQLVDQALEAARQRIFLAALAALGFGIVVAVGLAVLLARPIGLLRDGAHKIGEGNLDHRIRITTRDELGELAQEFNVMAARLQELDRLKQDFVSNVTHELRSPLTSLRGYVELLLKESAGPVTAEQREFLIVVKKNSVRLARFIDNLLDVAKIESGKIELHQERVLLQDLALEMSVVFRPMAQEKNINFHIGIDPHLPPLWADADKLLEVITNLLSNAFKFTPLEGQVALLAAAENNQIHLRVTDTGIGIPAEALASVFNKFEQVKPTTGLARKTKGSGLGLTLVKGFVEAHGGRVWIESEQDRGTTVHVVLRQAEPVKEETEQKASPLG
ncbi:MAG: HAMP domain-containing protein [Elusimicrobia bacterium]|nr:HAMP domain-containing protein [Elusimicrobiota bacterium]